MFYFSLASRFAAFQGSCVFSAKNHDSLAILNLLPRGPAFCVTSSRSRFSVRKPPSLVTQLMQEISHSLPIGFADTKPGQQGQGPGNGGRERPGGRPVSSPLPLFPVP